MPRTNALRTETAVWDHFDTVETGVRRRVAVADPVVKAHLDGLLVRITRHRAVEHPLLNTYRSTPFDPRQERLFYSECHYFFRHLPFYITGMAMMTRDEMILREIILSVADEVGTDPTRSTLFARFLARLGIDREHLDRYEPLEVTQQLNDGIRRLYTESSIYTALGALYADETMSSVMVSKIDDGLRNQGYDEPTRHFWTVRVDTEAEHGNSVCNAIAPYVGSADTRQEFEAGAFEFLELVERYWDGVHQLVGPAT
ncbi:iron-containing redox enzyme family protein [Streptomyces sp. NPDC059788]|uniref:iron-containing redox enzyme family protein n=1 Tax=Streptomyces sp. NPDC059788 TaxID=3346948 RepID=UPI00364D4A62